MGLKVIESAKRDRALCDFIIKSPFFEKICEEVETKNWVDIEDVYYEFLKKSDNPKQLNEDLDFIKSKLIEYLSSLPESTFNPIVRHQILAPINREDIAVESKDKWYELLKIRLDYSETKWWQLVAGYYNGVDVYNVVKSIENFKSIFKDNILSEGFIGDSKCPSFRLPDNIMLLNFNYTNTADLYLPEAYKFSVNHIHGSLAYPKSVIFGYGDEHDDEYQPLMNKKDNEYLRHIK